jgi:hypothetical protein
MGNGHRVGIVAEGGAPPSSELRWVAGKLGGGENADYDVSTSASAAA